MGKGGGKAHTPYEQPDNLKSRQQLSIIDLLCEGQIEGPVNGLKGVYLNKTPIQADDDSYNFKGVEAEWTAGTQAQAPLKGFPSTETEIPVSLEVKKTTPIVRAVTDPNVDRIRVTVGARALYAQQDNGDMVGTSAQLQVQVGNGSSWRSVATVVLSGKTRSQYLRSVMIEDLPQTPFNIRVVRITNDSTSSRIENKTVWASYTEIYDVKLTYPNTALVGLKFDSQQFNGMPSRQYLIKGMIVKVPDNYDPETRQYSGLWTGRFKLAWTDNPAWIFYDIVTNERYGLGHRIKSFGCDKFTLYTVAQYCDQLVDDGFGNKEPRFTCNCYITEQRQAYDVINDLCSIFRAMPVWDGMQLTTIMDRPADTTYIYTNANVVEGKFNYSSSAQKARHTAVHVKYVDPHNGWATATEYVADDHMISRFGLNVAKVDAFGCTSRGQAHRVGKWLIETERRETQTVTFSVGREGLRHLPGDIIGVADNDYSGAKLGGRIKAVDGAKITLDRTVEIEQIGDAIFWYIDQAGKFQKVGIHSHPQLDVVVLNEVVDLSPWSVWALSTSKIKPRLFKALGIAENIDDGTYTITALQHVSEKEAIVDSGAHFETDNNTLHGLTIPSVDQLQIDIAPEASWQARLSWSTPRVINDVQFEIKIYRDDKLVSRNVTSDTEFYIKELLTGRYSATVRGIDIAGRVGDESAIAFTIAPPAPPDSLVLTPSNFSVSIRPIVTSPTSLGTVYEFYKGQTREEVEAKTNYLGRSLVLTDQDCSPETEYWYGVNAVNMAGRSTLTIANTKTLEAINGAGGMFRIQTTDGIFPSNATELFHHEFGFYPARDAILTVYAIDENGHISHSETQSYDGGQWVSPAMLIDGNMIATGTIQGSRLVAGTEIVAPTIRSFGNPPPFELTSDGTLNAKKANITGQITATSGELNHVVINDSCEIKGTLTASQIKGAIIDVTHIKGGMISQQGEEIFREVMFTPSTNDVNYNLIFSSIIARTVGTSDDWNELHLVMSINGIQWYENTFIGKAHRYTLGGVRIDVANVSTFKCQAGQSAIIRIRASIRKPAGTGWVAGFHDFQITAVPQTSHTAWQNLLN